MIRKVIIQCLLLAVLPAGPAAETFYDRGDEGWFFYKSPPEPEPKTADDESQRQVAAADQINDDGPEKIFSAYCTMFFPAVPGKHKRGCPPRDSPDTGFRISRFLPDRFPIQYSRSHRFPH